jgi:hypothetical protein
VPNITDPFQALREAQNIKDMRYKLDTVRNVAPHLLRPERSKVIKDVIEELSGLEDEFSDDLALFKILTLLSEQNFSEVYSHWDQTLNAFAHRTRKNMLLDLCFFVPLLSKYGGDEALLETANAIESTGNWWH